MTEAERFRAAIEERWASRAPAPVDSSAFWQDAATIFMEEYDFAWGREVSGHVPNHMKELGRWLRDCYSGAGYTDEGTPQ